MLVLLAWATAWPARGAEQGPSAITAAYQKTKTAKTADDYGEIVRLCAEAQRGALSDELQKYTAQLQAWAYNRRGEVYVAQAGTAVEEGDGLLASQLDALALADFERSIQLDPARWKSWQNRGVCYGLEGRYEEAIADFGRALGLKPDQPELWFNRAEILLELGRAEEALRDYDETLRLAPRDDSAFMGRGQARSQLGQVEAALEDFDEAIRLNSSRSAPHARRGEVLERLGRWEDAATDYRRAIDLDGQSAAAYRGAAWLMATCPEPRFRSGQLALQAAERAWELAGKTGWQYLDTLAAAYANADQFERAAALAAEAVSAAPPGQREAVEQRLESYAQGRPFRQKLSENPTGTSAGTRLDSTTERGQ
jgi:tetratricopeptide (TPR) repeat protein